MQLITYRGDIAAVAGATRAHLAPHIAVLPDHHPVKQLVLELCLYAHRLAERESRGEPPEYLPGRAERYVREQRMLAEELNVPVWSRRGGGSWRGRASRGARSSGAQSSPGRWCKSAALFRR